MPDHLGDDMRKVKLDNKETEPEIEGNYRSAGTAVSDWAFSTEGSMLNIVLLDVLAIIPSVPHFPALDEVDIELLKTYVSIVQIKFGRRLHPNHNLKQSLGFLRRVKASTTSRSSRSRTTFKSPSNRLTS